MGLVSTWLTGIGLSSVVPTFQAAGIVTPTALAELDVAHFEALGVSDPDDRRKLFYLVQRIKMAVNKDKDKKESVEEQVDAVISLSNSTLRVPDEHQVPEEQLSTNTTSGNRHTTPKETTTESVELRRSRRLASKQDDNSSNAKENHSKNDALSSLDTRGKGRADDKTDCAHDHQNLVDNDREHSVEHHQTKVSSANARSTSQNTARGNLSKKANAVFNLVDEDDRIVEEPATTRTLPSHRTSGLRKPKAVTTTSSSSTEGSSTTSSTKTKVQNPGMSMRTGKQLSVIPSQQVAPMSPLLDLGATSSVPHNDRNKKSKKLKENQSVRRESTDSNSSEKLEELLQSSFSDDDPDEDVGSDNESRSTSRTRSKSMGGSEITSWSKSRPNARFPSNDALSSTTSKRRQSEDPSKAITVTQTESATKVVTAATRPTPSVLGGTTTESWATRVARLREDNDAEHKLFRHHGNHQVYEYDMRIRVIVRKRPVSKAEASLSGGVDVIHPLDYGDHGKVLVYQPKTRVDLTKEVEIIPFAFDNVFDETSTNQQIYRRSLRNLIHPFFQGQWATVFAYGQTGSGKTYTMMGSNMTGINAGTAKNEEANLGLYYLAALDIFDMVKRPEYRHLSVQVSLFEIYGGKLFDLLNARKQVKCLEDSKGKVCFPGLTEHPVGGPDDLMELIEEGATNRSTGTTSRNADSSRSHAVLQLKLRKDIGRKKNVEHGRLNFIDLAGSERGADTSSSSRATRMEGAEINTSLLALKEVIRALATGGSMTHIPFRGSKLTQVLKDSFVGENSRCCMVACVSPDIGNCEQTLNTLRYADRVKERNSDSGALSNGYEQPVRLQKLDQSVNMISEEMQPSQNAPSHESSPNDFDDEEADEFLDDNFSEAGETTIDDLLVKNISGNRIDGCEVTPEKIASDKLRAGEELIADHRSIMSKMLSMVKDEMILVNKVDADRDGLDDYLVKLESIQKTHLELISTLRGSLSNYVTVCEATNKANLVNAESDDESFEDLRD